MKSGAGCAAMGCVETSNHGLIWRIQFMRPKLQRQPDMYRLMLKMEKPCIYWTKVVLRSWIFCVI